jgi:phosphatidylglycerol---prolipoprotein diacylglyceryl transferase
MTMLSYILWNASPEIYSIGSFSLRWYGLFFASGFLITQQILYYMYRKEGKPEKDVDTLTIYMVVATILGARLGHIIFYQPEIIWENPASIFLPFEFKPFRFTGLQGLASHGATIGILTALWLYSRKKKAGQNFLQVVDRIVILVALTGALIRLGNYFNAEIIGKPTDKPWGVVFTGRLGEFLQGNSIDPGQIVEGITYAKLDTVSTQGLPVGRKPMNIYLFFKKGTTETAAESLVTGSFRYVLNSKLYEYFEVPGAMLDYEIAPLADGTLGARIRVLGIARHPAQLYEALSCVLLFIGLLLLWVKYKNNLPQGMLLGIFLIVCFGLRICYEFLKEPQEDFESDMVLYMGQILSIPLVIAGVFILWRALKKKDSPENAEI